MDGWRRDQGWPLFRGGRYYMVLLNEFILRPGLAPSTRTTTGTLSPED